MPDSKSKGSGPEGSNNPPAARPPRRRPPAPVYQPLGQTAGPSPDTPVEQVRLTIGTIVGTHGVGGELKLRLLTDTPEHLPRVKRVWIGDEAEPRRLTNVRFHAGMALITIAGVSNPEIGQTFRGQPVRIAGSDAKPLQPGEFFLYQVIGLSAFLEDGSPAGTVTDLIETGANDVFVITPAGGGPEMLIPNIPENVRELDPVAGRIVIRPLRFWDEA